MAATQGLHLYKTESVLEITLPFALLKSGRYRLSLAFALKLASRDPNSFIECARLVSQAILKYPPAIEQIDAAIELTKEQCLTPAAMGLICARIGDLKAREHFFDTYCAAHSISGREISLANAYIYKFTGDPAKALSIAQKLVQSNLRDTEACNLAADILADNDYTYEARRFACLSLRYSPGNIYALEVLGLSLYKEARWQAARQIFSLIHAQTGDDISLINSIIALPPLTLKAGDLEKAVNGFDDLRQLLLGSPQLIGIEKSLVLCKVPLPSEFYLAYQGSCGVRTNLEAARSFTKLSAQKLVSDIASYYSGSICLRASSGAAVKQKRRSRIQIGFISRFFSNHSNLQAHLGLIKQLDRRDFCIYLIHRAGAVVDTVHMSVNKLADHVIYLDDDFAGSCRTLAMLNLDILFFTDIGMSPLDSVLAMPHLARCQVTSWGLPHTTGVKEIDYYLRSSIFSDCEGQSEYTEKLLDLEGYLGYFSHESDKLNALPRDYFLLPPDRFLIGCLQALHKIHPDYDSYLEEIARIDESILIIISPTESDTQMRRFIDRIKGSAPTAYSRLCIVQRTSTVDFISLNHILDLNLDTIHYGAGITFVDTTWCGPPYVTQRSSLVKGSVVSRSYEFAGIENPPIAESKEEYIDLVRYCFNNRNELQRLRKDIHAKSEGTIYNNTAYIKSYESFFKEVAR